MATSYVYNEQTGEFEEREIIPPRIKYFRLRNRKAFLDKPCTIEWEVENASSVSLDRVGPQNTTGFFTFRPNGNSQWVLRAIGEGEVTETLEVKAYPLPKINSFTAQPEQEGWSFIVGDKITLNWNTEHYDNLEINGEDVSGEHLKVFELLDEVNEFTLTARCDEQTVSDTLQIQAHKHPVISFTANKEKLRLGKNEEVVLAWNIENATSAKLFINDNQEEISLNDSKTFTPSESTTYRLEVVALDGVRVFDMQKGIKVLPEALITFTTNREFSLPHVPLQLSWNIKHAFTAKITGDFEGAGDVELSGTKTIVIDRTQTIKLQVEDEFGITEKSLCIRMLPLPIIKGLHRPEPIINKTINVGVDISRPQMKITTPTNVFASLKPFVTQVQMPPLSIQMPFVERMTAPSEGWFTKGYKLLNNLTQIIHNKLTNKIS